MYSMKSIIVFVTVLVAGGVGYAMWPATSKTAATETAISIEDGALAKVLLPEVLSQTAQVGKRGFEAKCAACHGVNAAGQDGVAPPLVHIIYEPSHHGDEAFQRAVALGVRGHHWSFGDMPPVEGVTTGDVTMIIAYIRELQRANGIN
jgi:mono/diheme cytochrome c family protein